MDYARPEKIVETEWVEEHLDDVSIHIIECNEDVSLYKSGHIPGALHLEWFISLQHPVRRDIVTRDDLEHLLSQMGIANDSTLVFYGDQHNWFATYALWLLELYGHEECKLMNGGRAKWEREGRPMTTEVASYPTTNYRAKDPDNNSRALRDHVLAAIEAETPLIDVRTPEEYSGQIPRFVGQGVDGSAMRTGHIAGAVNIPWSNAIDERSGRLLPAAEVAPLFESQKIGPGDHTITYCRIGERSAHTWFVLKYVLGYPNVRNYDGSWAEWGNLINVPIET